VLSEDKNISLSPYTFLQVTSPRNVLFCNVAQPVSRATVSAVVCPAWRHVTQTVDFIKDVLRNSTTEMTKGGKAAVRRAGALEGGTPFENSKTSTIGARPLRRLRAGGEARPAANPRPLSIVVATSGATGSGIAGGSCSSRSHWLCSLGPPAANGCAASPARQRWSSPSDREPRGSASIPVPQTLYGACSRLRPTPLKLRKSPGVSVRKLANSYGISPQANKQK
jgi:hypothetical protein